MPTGKWRCNGDTLILSSKSFNTEAMDTLAVYSMYNMDYQNADCVTMLLYNSYAGPYYKWCYDIKDEDLFLWNRRKHQLIALTKLGNRLGKSHKIFQYSCELPPKNRIENVSLIPSHYGIDTLNSKQYTIPDEAVINFLKKNGWDEIILEFEARMAIYISTKKACAKIYEFYPSETITPIDNATTMQILNDVNSLLISENTPIVETTTTSTDSRDNAMGFVTATGYTYNGIKTPIGSIFFHKTYKGKEYHYSKTAENLYDTLVKLRNIAIPSYYPLKFMHQYYK